MVQAIGLYPWVLGSVSGTLGDLRGKTLELLIFGDQNVG